MSLGEISEIRNWILLILGTMGAALTIKTFIDNTRQRRHDNTYKALDYLRKHITDAQINSFRRLFKANNELSGVQYNEFRFEDGTFDTIENMFSEGGCGNGDIHNMIEVFNLISKFLNKHILDDELIWYEYGQLMFTCYRWTKYLEDKTNKTPIDKPDYMSDTDFKKFESIMLKNRDYINSFYTDFNIYVGETKFIGKPVKTYIYAE